MYFLHAALDRCAEGSWELSRGVKAPGEGPPGAGVLASCCCCSCRTRSRSTCAVSRLGGGGSACAALAADTIACGAPAAACQISPRGISSQDAR